MTRFLRSSALTLAASLLLPFAAARAQTGTNAFGSGAKVVDLGVVTDPTGIGGGFEFGLRELASNVTLGLGAAASYQSESALGIDVSTTWIAGLVNVHYAFPELPALDLFGGLSLGIVSASVDVAGDDASDSDLGVGLNFGARYMFTPKFGGTIRLGIEDAPDLFLGIAIRL